MSLPESVHDAVFVFSASGLVLGSLGVVFFVNIVHSALSLGSVFACISLLYLSMNADFAAVVQILIYVGAVNVLILFAVMLVSQPQYPHPAKPWTVGDGITLALCTSAFLLLINMILYTSWYRIFPIVLRNAGSSPTHSVQRIGSYLLTEFLLPFELLSIVLLVALVGAITVARREQVIGQETEPALRIDD